MFSFAVLFPILCGFLLLLLPPHSKRVREWIVLGVTLLTSLSVVVCLRHVGEKQVLLPLTENLSLVLGLDGAGAVFSALVAFLWPLAVLYGFEYMEHEGGENHFFAMYTLSYGVTLGISMAANLITMYAFFELLTLTTLPLVMHGSSQSARRAGHRYMLYNMGGAALALIGILLLVSQGANSFVMGGHMQAFDEGHHRLVQAAYLCTFLGLGVKAAVFPLHAWLPEVSVAPMPVTALLHAVAVVKAGAFAVLRVTYYSFGASVLLGTKAQTAAIMLSAFTIVYGAVRAVREHHFKRRLVWSTVSNLSYILLAVSLMTPEGLLGGMAHLVFHAFMKITLFYCAGAFIVRTGKDQVEDLRGLARFMPMTCFIYALAALSLTGTPPLPGFISKYLIGSALISAGTWQGFVGLAALLTAAVLTGIYILFPAFFMFFRSPDAEAEEVYDPGLKMALPLAVLAVSILLAGLFSNHLITILTGLL